MYAALELRPSTGTNRFTRSENRSVPKPAQATSTAPARAGFRPALPAVRQWQSRDFGIPPDPPDLYRLNHQPVDCLPIAQRRKPAGLLPAAGKSDPRDNSGSCCRLSGNSSLPVCDPGNRRDCPEPKRDRSRLGVHSFGHTGQTPSAVQPLPGGKSTDAVPHGGFWQAVPV